MTDIYTPVASIISDAYREANIVALGNSPTTNQQAEALARLNRYVKGVYGFELGEPLIDWMIPQPQRTAPVAANYPQAPYPLSTDASILPFPLATEADPYVYPYPPSNSRIVWGGSTITVWLPEQPENGARIQLVQGSGAGDNGQDGNVLTIDANGRWIGAPGTATAQFTFSKESPIAPQSWIYISDTAAWTLIADLALTDSMPFPSQFDDLWTTALMIRLAPRYNKTTAAETKLIFEQMLMKIKQAYRQTAPTVYGSFDFPRSLQSYISGQWFWETIFAVVGLTEVVYKFLHPMLAG